MRFGLTGFLLLVLLGGCNNRQSQAPLAETPALPPIPSGGGVEVLDESDFEFSAKVVDPFEGLYNPESLGSVTGPVLGMRRIVAKNERTFLVLEVGLSGEFFDVLLGPEDYLTQHGLSLGVTDQVQAVGSRTVRNTRNTIVARTVREGNVTVPLRDETGRALWQ